MKYRIITLFAVASTLLCSCNKWLDITPEDTSTEKQLFSNAGGFHVAINGLYQDLSSSSLYGKNLTWGYLSALSQYYDNASVGNTKEFSYTEQYDYDSKEVLAFGEQIWQKGYNVIANANNIIQNLDKVEPSFFSGKEMEMNDIRGEALAVRALVHFDLLRLFADAPAVNKQAQGIPYVTSFPCIFSDRLTSDKVIANVLKDLEDAARLVAPNDTSDAGLSSSYMSSTGNRYMVSNSSVDYFFTGRGTRMNYIAIKSIMARVYAYNCELKKAYDIAKDIRDNFIDTPDPWYKYTGGFSDTDTDASRPHKLVDEILVSFFDENLSTTYKNKVSASQLSANAYAIKNASGIFADNDDYRSRKLLSTISQNVKVSLKYLERAGNNTYENKIIPVMRLSELDMIMAEYLAGQGQMAEAAAILNRIRVSRGCMGNTLADDISADDFNKALNLEVWRENVAEGQYFFFCKRINAATINNGGSFVQMDGKYTMRIPDSQVNFN